ncbi:MAG TPA: hypothetical protein VGR11_11070 [Solirubrobacteraceae bacterium]|nr:hypothetical protein [Solirubrobacteraceae bacterium]
MQGAPDSQDSPITPQRLVDDDYEYFWSAGGVEFRIPRWLGEIIEVPLLVRLEVFLFGVCTGLILAALSVVVAFYSAV